jgi:hypothetical protein
MKRVYEKAINTPTYLHLYSFHSILYSITPKITEKHTTPKTQLSLKFAQKGNLRFVYQKPL